MESKCMSPHSPFIDFPFLIVLSLSPPILGCLPSLTVLFSCKDGNLFFFFSSSSISAVSAHCLFLLGVTYTSWCGPGWLSCVAECFWAQTAVKTSDEIKAWVITKCLPPRAASLHWADWWLSGLAGTSLQLYRTDWCWWGVGLWNRNTWLMLQWMIQILYSAQKDCVIWYPSMWYPK